MTDEASAELERRLRAGDELVLTDILRTHGPPVRAVLKRRFGSTLDDSDWEDVLAVALFRVWQARDRFDPLKASLRVWFFRIAENAARDVLKVGWQKARLLEVGVEPIALAEVAAFRHLDLPLPTETLISSESLQAALALLPEAQRQIVMADAQSRDGIVPSEQLGAELGLPPGTVRVYRKRALDRLRRELSET